MARPDETEWLSLARARMALDMGGGAETEVLAGAKHFARWAEEAMLAGTYLAWIVECDSARVACAGLWLKPHQPDVLTGDDTVPYVLNVYCDPAHRRRGLARMLMAAITSWARSYGFKALELHASDDARPLYAALGFVPTTEMRLSLAEAAE